MVHQHHVPILVGGGHPVLVLLVPLSLPHSLEHSLGLVHLRLLLLDAVAHSRMGILWIAAYPFDAWALPPGEHNT